jgi:hypothetical protein
MQEEVAMQRFITFNDLMYKLANDYPGFKEVEILVHYDPNNKFVEKIKKQYCFTIDKCILKDKDNQWQDVTISEDFVAITHRYCYYKPYNVVKIFGKNKLESFPDEKTGNLVKIYKPKCL